MTHISSCTRQSQHVFEGGNKNHDYKEKFLEILWDPNIAMSN